MRISATHTIDESITRIIIFVRNNNNENIDADVSVIISEESKEHIFLPKPEDLNNQKIDPVYPGIDANSENRFVSRIDKGIYQVILKNTRNSNLIRNVKIITKTQKSRKEKTIHIKNIY